MLYIFEVLFFNPEVLMIFYTFASLFFISFIWRVLK